MRRRGSLLERVRGGAGLPVVLGVFAGEPVGEGHQEIVGEGVNVRFVEVAEAGERYVVAGRALFEPPGSTKAHALTAFDEDPESDLFFVFADATSGTETYEPKSS